MDIRLRRDDAGFGLIEVLVVVAITSILAVGASLAMPRGVSDLDRAAARLEAEAADLRHRAMVSGVDHALMIEPDGWTQARWQGGAGWRRLDRVTLAGVDLAVPPGSEPLVLGADGTTRAPVVTLRGGGATRRCAPGGAAGLTCAAE